MAIGHNRYSTSGGSDEALNQPYIDESLSFAFAHNGNLPITKKLEEYLNDNGINSGGTNDSGLMALALSNELKITGSIEKSVRTCWPLFTGAFCCVGLYKGQMFAFRDQFGIRPLSLGKTHNGYVVASETAALDIIGADFTRDIKPGELVVIHGSELESFQIQPGTEKLDAFEFVYLARPDSRLAGQSVYSARRRYGMALAKVDPVKADIVIAVPDSGTPAAVGYAQESNIPFELGLIKNRYIGRTFIEPEKIRKNSVELKFNVIVEIIAGKDVVLVDDSLVRGNTLKFVIKLLRQYGAKSIHVRIASPPVKYPDYYGIDTPKDTDLIASHHNEQQISEMIDADSLAYLPLGDFIKATGLPKDRLCLSCFNGEYPIPIA
jgi:amidophosphoribosyltransferase